MQTPQQYPQSPYPPQYPAPQPPKKGNGCLIGGIIAAILALCGCVVVAGILFLSLGQNNGDGGAGGDLLATAMAGGSQLEATATPAAPVRAGTATVAPTARATVRPGATVGAATTIVAGPTPRPNPTVARVGTPTGSDVFPTTSPGARNKSMQQQTFDQAAKLIEDNYVDPKLGGIDWAGAKTAVSKRIEAGMTDGEFWAAMTGLIDNLGDGHSHFLNPVEAQQEAAAYLGEDAYIGMGLTVSLNEDKHWLYVLRLVPGGPAEKAGVRLHDILVSIDGKPVVDGDGVPQMGLLRGTEGASSRVVLHQPGKPERTVTVTRAIIRPDAAIDYRMLPGARKIGYIRLSTFDEKTVRDKLDDALEKLMEQNGGKLDGLVLDLRQNTGGTYPQLSAALGAFVKKSPGEFVDRNGKREPIDLFPIETGNSHSVKLALLIGRDTESFGEVFAGALQSQRGAILVGQPSAGNIELLQGFRLIDGSRMSIAVQTYQLPGGGNWEGKGLTPNVPVPAAWDDFGNEDADPVLQAAITALSR